MTDNALFSVAKVTEVTTDFDRITFFEIYAHNQVLDSKPVCIMRLSHEQQLVNLRDALVEAVNAFLRDSFNRSAYYVSEPD